MKAVFSIIINWHFNKIYKSITLEFLSNTYVGIFEEIIEIFVSYLFFFCLITLLISSAVTLLLNKFILNILILLSLFLIIFIFIQSYQLTYKSVITLFIISYFILLLCFFIVGLYSYNYNKLLIVNLGKFVCLSGYYTFYLSFILDYISLFFSFLITFITFIVLFFIRNYFKMEPEINKFTLLIISFSTSMIMLIISSNLLFFFFWWEMIGLTSYFLINFYYMKKNVFKSSYKAFFFNKISDNCILIGIILFLQNGISTLQFLPGFLNLSNLDFSALFFFFIGASIKSSQIGFHFWLPDSMEAPVPASALIHSATLVSAGIYVVIRLYEYVIFFKYFFSFLYLWYSITALYGGIVASFQIDIKKLLAYSTISHCGFLFITTLNGVILNTIIYLLLHGIFKAISFIIAGRIIQQLDSQDLRCMSQLHSILPLDSSLFIFSMFNLCAIPTTLGLFYKVLMLTTLINIKISYFILCLNFFASLTSIAYLIHIIKIFYTKHLKYKKFIFFKFDNNPTIFTCILSFLLFIIIVLIYIYINFYFIDILYLEFINKNNTCIFIIYYCFVLSYIFIQWNMDIYKNKNYIYYYYISFFILIFLI